MKIIEDITKMKDIYEKVLNLYLREQGTCALSASLKDRAMTWVADRFCPWLEKPVDLDAHAVQVLPPQWKSVH
jgi:hypothetical protein